ncbi:hypothetical protein BgiMline_029149 [Biomphalaria glabrata]|nr:hypothetical protein BgiMline_025776 [Biomphalaria glabrata]
MRSDTEQRPGSADTMVLILKRREEDYKQVSPQFPGTKNEQQAYRKNRVIQMRLDTYLNEVNLQEKRSASILKTERRRLLQKCSKRPTTPPSVRMIEQLKKLRRKKIPQNVIGTQEIPVLKGKDTVDLIAELVKESKSHQGDFKSLDLFSKNRLSTSVFSHDRKVLDDKKLSSRQTISTMSTNELKLQFPIVNRNYRDSTKQWKDLHPVKSNLSFPNNTASRSGSKDKETFQSSSDKTTSDLGQVKRSDLGQVKLSDLGQVKLGDLGQVKLKVSSVDTKLNDILQVKSDEILKSASKGKFTSGSMLSARPKLTSNQGSKSTKHKDRNLSLKYSHRKLPHSIDLINILRET